MSQQHVFDSNKLFQWAVDHGFDPSMVPASEPANWVMKALHPATPAVGPVTGVPDNDSQPTLTFHWRQVDQVAPPSGLSAGDTWDLEIIHLPGPCLTGAFRSKKSTASWTSGATYGWLFNKQYDFTNGGTAVPLTIGIDGTLSGGTANRWPRDVTKSRCMYASFTGILNAPTLSDQGMLVCAQTPNILDPRGISAVRGALDGGDPTKVVSGSGIDTFWANLDMQGNQQGPEFDTLLNVSPTAEQWRAKEGYYFPLRFGSGLFEWQDSSTSLSQVQNPWVLNSAGTAPTSLGNVPPQPVIGNTMNGVACFRGLASSASLSITTRLGYECVIPAASGYVAFVTPSCSPDVAMVEKYFKLSSQLADVYPASYNSDDLLSGVINGISGVLGSVLPPPFNMIAKAGGSLVTGLLGNRSKSNSNPQKKSNKIENLQGPGSATTRQANAAAQEANSLSAMQRANVGTLMPGIRLPKPRPKSAPKRKAQPGKSRRGPARR